MVNCNKCGREDTLFELMRYPNKLIFNCRYCGNQTYEYGQTKFEEKEEDEEERDEE